MKRTVAKIAFVGVAFVAAVAVAVWISSAFNWEIGLGGSLGAVVLIMTPKLFDRIWPKPMKGWSK